MGQLPPSHQAGPLPRKTLEALMKVLNGRVCPAPMVQCRVEGERALEAACR